MCVASFTSDQSTIQPFQHNMPAILLAKRRTHILSMYIGDNTLGWNDIWKDYRIFMYIYKRKKNKCSDVYYMNSRTGRYNWKTWVVENYYYVSDRDEEQTETTFL